MSIRPMDFVDVFVYLVVLGFFIEFFPEVLTESFMLALLTAILLKIVLELVLLVKKAILARIRASETALVRGVNVFALLLVLPGSKFLVLELVALIFGDTVKLGGFLSVTALIVVLMLARGGVRRFFAISDTKGTAPAGSEPTS